MIFQSTKNITAAISSKVTGLSGLWTSALMLLLLVGSYSGASAQDAAVGKTLFEANCKRCHNPKLEKGATGPALYGVSARVPSKEWLYEWIRNSGKVIASGDAYATKIFNENNGAVMDPMPHLTNEDIDNIMAWIDAYQPATTGGPDGGTNAIDASQDPAISGMWGWVKFLVFLVVVLLLNIALQIARVRGVEFLAGVHLDKVNARLMLAFYILGMIGAFWSIAAFKDYFIFSNSASEHGAEIDQLFWITMAITMIVFVVTNALLFWFAYRYGKDGGRKAKYYPENHKLELIWTVVPAVVLTILIIFGIKVWTTVMTPPEGNIVTVEVSGKQWGWQFRYPGADGKLGAISVHNIDMLAGNDLGVSASDSASWDDFIAPEMVIPVGTTVDLKIRSQDVLHSVYLPHFRVKMDAVPGMDTRFHFKATMTTEQFRETLKDKKYWSEVKQIDTLTVDGVTTLDTVYNWETFNFEMACTEVCGKGHWSMQKVVKVVTPEEYEKWFMEQSKSPYLSGVNYKQEDEFPQLAQEKTEQVGGDEEIVLE